VFAYALRRAERLGHEDATDVHIALGMIQEGRSVAAAILHHRGVPFDVLERELEAELPPVADARPHRDELAWSAGIERALGGAMVESRELGTEYYGVEHVMLALLRDAASPPARVLAKHGVAYEDMRSELERVRNTPPSA
jgi:ATP-dependent Clp protease ATP-binding subunit ClpA